MCSLDRPQLSLDVVFTASSHLLDVVFTGSSHSLDVVFTGSSHSLDGEHSLDEVIMNDELTVTAFHA